MGPTPRSPLRVLSVPQPPAAHYCSKFLEFIIPNTHTTSFQRLGDRRQEELLPVLEVQGDAAGKEAGGKLIPGSRVEEGEVKMMNLGEHV